MNDIVTHFAKSKPSGVRCARGTISIGNILGSGMAGRISQSQKRMQTLNDFWNSALPADFLPHLRLAGIKDGCLLVEVNSSSYGYELFLRSHDLLKQMREHHFPVKRIQFVFGDSVRCG